LDPDATTDTDTDKSSDTYTFLDMLVRPSLPEHKLNKSYLHEFRKWKDPEYIEPDTSETNIENELETP